MGYALDSAYASPSNAFVSLFEYRTFFSWMPSPVWVDHYQVNVTNPDGKTISKRTVTNSQTTVNFENLNLATLYNVEVFAMRNGKASSAASGQHLTLIPAPRNFRVMSTNLTTIQIRWVPPKISANTTISKYKISYSLSRDDTADQSINYISGRQRAYKIRGLTPGTQYEIEIAAVVATTKQEGSKAVVVASTLLASPTHLVFTQSSGASLSFKWERPEGDVTGYEVTLIGDPNRQIELTQERFLQIISH